MTASTDVATTEQQGGMALVPTAPEQITAALEQWVGGMAASVRGAEYMVDTPMCPDSFWPIPPGVKTKTPKQLLPGEDLEVYRERRRVASYTLGSVVRYGLQLGLPPEVAVQGIFTIGGRMSMYAEQMVALVKSRGHGHRVVERSRERCVIEVRRAGEDDWRRFEFTIDDAIGAGYVPNAGPNANPGKWPDGNPKQSGGNAKYLTDPAAMLYARASSIGCKTEFPDVLRGLTSYEEMQDEQRSQPVDITASVEVSRPAERPTAAAILAAAGQGDNGGNENPADVTPAAAPVERAVLPITDPQLRMLGTVMTNLGVSGTGSRERRLTIASRIVDRPLTSSKELSKDEASTVIDTLTSVLNATDGPARLHELEHGKQTQPVDSAADAADEARDAWAEQGDDDPNGQWDGMDGAEAAAEGNQ
jgi:hypothetical protein